MRCCTSHRPARLPAPPAIRYSLFAEVDPTHRGIAKVERPGEPVALSVLDPARAAAHGAPRAGRGARRDEPASPQRAEAPSRWQFLEEGIRHILSGYDHVLFLLCLLLPAVMRRRDGRWQPVERLSQAILPVAGIVTAFTVAHSITLALAALEAGVAAVVVHRAGDRGDDRARRDRQRLAGLPGAPGGRRPSSSA